jgi:hypothetical protein
VFQHRPGHLIDLVQTSANNTYSDWPGRFFEGLLDDPSNWESNPLPDPTPAIDSYKNSSRDHYDAEHEEILEAELIDAEPGDDTRPEWRR